MATKKLTLERFIGGREYSQGYYVDFEGKTIGYLFEHPKVYAAHLGDRPEWAEFGTMAEVFEYYENEIEKSEREDRDGRRACSGIMERPDGDQSAGRNDLSLKGAARHTATGVRQ